MQSMEASELDSILAQCRASSVANGNLPPYPSIIAQLEYLHGLAAGRSGDSSRLKDFVLGVQAAREIEALDMPLAMKLYDVSAWVRSLRSEK